MCIRDSDDIAELLIKEATQKSTKKLTQKTTTSITKKLAPKVLPTAGKVVRNITKKAAPQVVNKTLQNSDGVFLRALRNPAVVDAIVNKIGKEGAEKIGIKLAAGGTKGGFPIFGTAYAAVEGLVRLALGDPEGMMLSFGSGIPAAGWGFAIIDILRDIDKEAYNKHIRPNLPLPNDTNLAGYFMDAFNIGIDQLERGNTTFKAPTGMGASVGAISEILGVTQAFGSASGFGGEVSALISSEGLSSFPIPKMNYNFDVGKVGSGDTSSNQSLIQGREEELKMTRKLDKELNDDDDDDKDEGIDIEIHSNPFMDRVRDFTGGEVGDGVFTLPFGIEIPNIFHGGGGIGGNDTIQATTPIMGGDGATIQFWGEQGRDLSGEPGVDFSYKDYKSNYNLFPGYVLETGLLYGNRYGNVVVVRSVDPSNGLEFDSLYSHFPNGGIAVKPGQVVSAGEYLGAVGFIGKRGPNGEARMQGNGAGNMSGYHTSVDFYEPGSYDKYRNLSVIQSLVTGAEGQTPVGLLEKLKPPTKSNDQSSLNSIEANTNLSLAMTNKVENGSNERLMTQRQATKKNPIVIVNNQTISNNTSPIIFGNNNDQEDDFFEAFNLARHTV